ncbi:uncharacterized protein LOC130690483 [Daphnia carinata]|uniref:uncharacterized protein LOC130690483 n=1 Tax=Daphnia carinata TaxID=120202 RepID=UPI002579B401|nr:uncharacterized protein LOC130690483 [Daphnia carinata]
MRSTFSILMLVCLFCAVHFQPSHSHQPSGYNLKGLSETRYDHGKHGIDVISSRKFGIGLKAILFKPLLLLALAKIKLALLVGKPLVLLALKKLLLKAVLGKLLLKIPLILLGGKALIAKVLALKFALITKGLVGLKAPLVMLFLGGFLKGLLKGTGLGLAIAGSLLKLKGHETSEEEYDDYYYPPVQSYVLPPPAYRAPASYGAPAAPSYGSGASLGGNHFESGISGFGGGYGGGRKRRNVNDDESGEEIEDSEEDFSGESADDLKLEFEAARTNGNAYLYMAAQFDEQSCGRRLMCEVYQKAHESLTEDEIILKDIFGYPLPALRDEDKGTPTEAYYRAAHIGASHQGRSSNQICARFYSTCPHNTEQLIHMFVTEDFETNEVEQDNRPVAHLQPPQTSARLPFYHHRQPISPTQQWKPATRPIQAQQLNKVNTTPGPVRRPVASAPVTPLRQRFVAAPAA